MLMTPIRPRSIPPPGVYRLDPETCLVELSVRHLMVLTARGRLRAIGGDCYIDPDDLTASWVRVDLDSASFDTGSVERDEVVVGPDFLAADEYPIIRFASTGVSDLGDGRYRVVGDLFLRDLVGTLELDARVVGLGGGTVTIAAEGTLSRAQLGLTWGSAIERTGLVVADSVHVAIAAELER
jgi:polyisoprenoid-binding protein YceI